MMEQSSLVLKNSSRARCYSSSVFGFIAYRSFCGGSQVAKVYSVFTTSKIVSPVVRVHVVKAL